MGKNNNKQNCSLSYAACIRNGEPSPYNMPTSPNIRNTYVGYIVLIIETTLDFVRYAEFFKMRRMVSKEFEINKQDIMPSESSIAIIGIYCKTEQELFNLSLKLKLTYG